MFRSRLTRNGLELTRAGPCLTIRSIDHHAGPAHLSHLDLLELGLATRPLTSSLRTSAVLHCRGNGAFCDEHAPHVFSDAPRLVLGDYELVAVREGLDVFVFDYHSDPLVFPVSSWPALKNIERGLIEPRSARGRRSGQKL
ncbi:MAG: hypothetical protein ACK4N5_18315 [Myxococcales bacterium]